MKIAKQIILSPDCNRCPVAVCVLLGFVYLIFSHICGKSFGVFLNPVRMQVFRGFARWFGTMIHRRFDNLELIDSVGTDGMSGKGGVPGVRAGIDGAPVFENDVEISFKIADHGAIGTMGRII